MTDDLRREFDRLKPWVTKFTIDGQDYGGRYDAAHDLRLSWFQQHFPVAERILELGSLEGGHTFALAALPHVRHITAVEGRADNLRRARFVQRLLDQPKVEFVEGNLETFDLGALGQFDAALCLGVLYHLPEPWKLIHQLSRVTPAIYLWTHYAAEERARQRRNNYQGRVYREWLFFFEALSGLSPGSFWPTRPDLLRMLHEAGYVNITVLADDAAHVHGPAITLVARRA